jgi:hypothetical protein
MFPSSKLAFKHLRARLAHGPVDAAFVANDAEPVETSQTPAVTRSFLPRVHFSLAVVEYCARWEYRGNDR